MFKSHHQSNPMRSMKSNGNSASSTSSVRSVSNAVKVSNGNSVMMQTRKQQKPSSPKSQNSQDSYDEVDDAPVPEGLVRCQICKRNFAEDRLEKHQTICQKTKAKKRKVYDASKKRVQVRLLEYYTKDLKLGLDLKNMQIRLIFNSLRLILNPFT